MAFGRPSTAMGCSAAVWLASVPAPKALVRVMPIGRCWATAIGPATASSR